MYGESRETHYWNREVDRNTIFSEVGRISNLNQSPHLKIFVAKKLTESARETALKSGFIVIELGEKAEKIMPKNSMILFTST